MKSGATEIKPISRETAGVDVALFAIKESTFVPPLCFDPMTLPVLSGLERVEPIESVEGLIDAVAHATEQVDSAIEVERILDGISRLCDQKPDDFDRRVAPLIRRIEKIKDAENFRSISVQTNGTPEVCA